MSGPVMLENLDFSKATVQKVIVHCVGNKFRDEGVVLSSAESERSESLDELLLKSFLIPTIKNGDECVLMHESDIHLNTIKHYSSIIFHNNQTFFESSIAIAKHLYASSTHPNIEGGEFIEILYDKIQKDGQNIQAVGFFKIETKSNYLDVKNDNGTIDIVEKVGISIESIQKGAVILSVDDIVFIVDSLGKKTKYWIEGFIKAKPRNTEKKYIHILSDITKTVSKKIKTPNNSLLFTESLSSQNDLSVDTLKELSANFIPNEDFDSVVNAVGIKHGVMIDTDFSIETTKLSKKFQESRSKLFIAEGVNLVVSNQNIQITAIDVQKTNTGLRAIIDIE